MGADRRVRELEVSCGASAERSKRSSRATRTGREGDVRADDLRAEVGCIENPCRKEEEAREASRVWLPSCTDERLALVLRTTPIPRPLGSNKGPDPRPSEPSGARTPASPQSRVRVDSQPENVGPSGASQASAIVRCLIAVRAERVMVRARWGNREGVLRVWLHAHALSPLQLRITRHTVDSAHTLG